MQSFKTKSALVAAVAAVLASACAVAGGEQNGDNQRGGKGHDHGPNWPNIKHFPRGGHVRGDAVTVGPRPLYLVDQMTDGPLKDELEACADEPVRRTDFSITHRGAPLQFPEHTLEAYLAGSRMGAGVLECDVTFTSDGALVCRHGYNDLHTTTNITATPLESSCRTPFSPAEFDAAGKRTKAAVALCITPDITLAQFRTLRGKMDASNANALTASEYLGGTAEWRTNLYSTTGTLLSFEEHIELAKRLGLKHTPELKEASADLVAKVFGSQEKYALALAAQLQDADVRSRDAYPQSFNPNDVLTWVTKTPYKQAVFLFDWNNAAKIPAMAGLDGKAITTREAQLQFLRDLRKAGVKIVAPSISVLLTVENGRVVASQWAKDYKALGFDIITWSFERTDLRKGAAGVGGYYAFDPSGDAIKTDGDMYLALDALARDVKVIGVFSDWPGTVSYYASCTNQK
jgi:glycerophosphoryl diester phosphodiesterase